MLSSQPRYRLAMLAASYFIHLKCHLHNHFIRLHFECNAPFNCLFTIFRGIIPPTLAITLAANACFVLTLFSAFLALTFFITLSLSLSRHLLLFPHCTVYCQQQALSPAPRRLIACATTPLIVKSHNLFIVKILWPYHFHWL